MLVEWILKFQVSKIRITREDCKIKQLDSKIRKNQCTNVNVNSIFLNIAAFYTECRAFSQWHLKTNKNKSYQTQISTNCICGWNRVCTTPNKNILFRFQIVHNVGSHWGGFSIYYNWQYCSSYITCYCGLFCLVSCIITSLLDFHPIFANKNLFNRTLFI